MLIKNNIVKQLNNYQLIKIMKNIFNILYKAKLIN